MARRPHFVYIVLSEVLTLFPDCLLWFNSSSLLIMCKTIKDYFLLLCKDSAPSLALINVAPQIVLSKYPHQLNFISTLNAHKVKSFACGGSDILNYINEIYCYSNLMHTCHTLRMRSVICDWKSPKCRCQLHIVEGRKLIKISSLNLIVPSSLVCFTTTGSVEGLVLRLST